MWKMFQTPFLRAWALSVSGVLTVVGTIAIMFRYCWQLTLITMVSVLLTVYVTKIMSKKMPQRV